MKSLNTKRKEKLLNTVREQLQSVSETKEELSQIDKIIEAMRLIERQFFVEPGNDPYSNRALPIGQKQTISQPYTVARILQLTAIESGDDVLEVGSGSGWNACIMAVLAYPGRTVSIERIPQLSAAAKATTDDFIQFLESSDPENASKISNLEFKTGNIFNITEYKNYYDKIIITAGINFNQENIIEGLADHLLKSGGRLVCPYASGPLILMDKKNEKIKTSYTSENYAFVPLILSH